MDRDFLRLILKNGIPRRLDAVWQYLIVAALVALFVESEAWLPEGTLSWLVRFYGFLLLFCVQHAYLRWLVARRLELTRANLIEMRTKSGEDSDELWLALSYAAKPDWFVAFLQAMAVLFVADLYVEHGIFRNDFFRTYDWVFWLFLGWMAVQMGLRSSSLDKVSETYYRHMYLANTSPPDEGTQTHSHA